MKIIPAIDILDGRCVRLHQGNYKSVTVYDRDPLQMAKKIEALGVEFLHVVDLDGARSKGVVNYSIVEAICKETSLKVDFGGGIKSEMDINRMIKCGVNQITVGSLAVKDHEAVQRALEKYGPERIVLGADCRNEKIAITGWTQSTEIHLTDLIDMYVPLGLKTLICTDISKDGAMLGPSIALYKKIIAKYSNLEVIASGGVRNGEDVRELKTIGCGGAIIGKSLYEGTLPWEELTSLC